MKGLIAILLLALVMVGCSSSQVDSSGSFDNEEKPYLEPFFWDDLRDQSEDNRNH